MVRAGHVSSRRKTKTPAPARINTTSANAAGQENFPEGADFNIGCWTLSVGRFLQSPKKYRPPRPMGVKGGCSPPEHLTKSGQLLPELEGCRNKNFYKLCSPSRGRWKTKGSTMEMWILKGRFSRDVSPNTCGIGRCAF